MALVCSALEGASRGLVTSACSDEWDSHSLGCTLYIRQVRPRETELLAQNHTANPIGAADSGFEPSAVSPGLTLFTVGLGFKNCG